MTCCFKNSAILALYRISVSSENSDYLFTRFVVYSIACQRGRYASAILTGTVNKITSVRVREGANRPRAVNDAPDRLCLSNVSIQIYVVASALCVLKVVSHNTARFIDQMVKQQKLTVTRAACGTYIASMREYTLTNNC